MGGLLYHQVNTVHTQTIMFLTFLNNVAVDLFAIISGYVGLTSHHRISRIVVASNLLFLPYFSSFSHTTTTICR